MELIFQNPYSKIFISYAKVLAKWLDCSGKSTHFMISVGILWSGKEWKERYERVQFDTEEQSYLIL